MSCSNGKMTKKRIITLLVVVTGIAVTIYAISIATKNFAILTASPLVLGFLACPLMCGVMAGGMWLSCRLSRNKRKTNLQTNSGTCCQHDHEHDHDSFNKNKGNGSDGNVSGIGRGSAELKTNNDNIPNLDSPHWTSNGKFKIHPD